jgi:hypothetical protein
MGAVHRQTGLARAVDESKREDIEHRIAELKRRWPAHSAPPRMWEELEELEDELKRISDVEGEAGDGRQAGSGRLPQVRPGDV